MAGVFRNTRFQLPGVPAMNEQAALNRNIKKKASWIRKDTCHKSFLFNTHSSNYEGHLESKERFAIQRYLLIIGKKKNLQVL